MTKEKGNSMDEIVQEVLYRLGKIQKAFVIEEMEYPPEILKNAGYLQELRDIEALEKGMTLWLPGLTRYQMMSIANGLPKDRVSTWCLEALLKGVTVCLRREDLTFFPENHEDSPLLRKHTEALELLTESGLKLVEHNAFEPEKDQSESFLYYRKKLLNEKTARNWKQKAVKEVMIDPKTIVTPLAADVLREGQIKWCKE
ncbi:hypothetical protein SAMN05192551_10249 [Tindallia magadiensis]|uniref:Ethanolamine utilization protein n=1 Tax=Tindallia magadiensis TaxID=69895 RepID=A0A1I3BWM9_9FIRM|nr:hypothetical protein [Tindallia magadiensis]SFH66151.1 hypothetical protein SAMN05192551_10249 [Tindallia magadiensis]